MRNQTRARLSLQSESYVKVALLISETRPALLMMEQSFRLLGLDVTRFSDVSLLELWLQDNHPALVIVPLTLRDDLLWASPIVKAAMKIKESRGVKFMAISDLEEKVRSIPAAQDTIRMLQGLMDFVPLKVSSDELSELIQKSLRRIQDAHLEGIHSPGFFFLRGRENPRTFQELLQAYEQGLSMIKRVINCSDCSLLALDPETERYRVVRASRQEHNEGYWDFSFSNIIPKCDILSKNGYSYFQPVRNYVGFENRPHTFGFFHVFRERSRRPMNTDEASLLEVLAGEVTGVSRSFELTAGQI